MQEVYQGPANTAATRSKGCLKMCLARSVGKKRATRRPLFEGLVVGISLELPPDTHVVVHIVGLNSCAWVGVVAVLEPGIHSHAGFIIKNDLDTCV